MTRKTADRQMNSFSTLYVTRFEKTDHVRTTSEMHFVAPYHRCIHNIILIKTQWQDNKRWPDLLSTWLFLGHANHWKASTDGEGPLGGFNRMAWTQVVSFGLASSSVVVCDCYGVLFGMWMQLEVPLSVFCLTEDLSPPSHPLRLPPPTRPL